jgi:hypothetical protein
LKRQDGALPSTAAAGAVAANRTTQNSARKMMIRLMCICTTEFHNNAQDAGPPTMLRRPVGTSVRHVQLLLWLRKASIFQGGAEDNSLE